jgi:hypothetical protein
MARGEVAGLSVILRAGHLRAQLDYSGHRPHRVCHTAARMIFLDADFSCIGQFMDINSIVQNHHLVNLTSLWAHLENHPPPFFTFKSPPPTKPFLAHNKVLAHKHIWSHLSDGVMPPCQCHKYPHLKHQAAGHIITTDYDHLPILSPNSTYVLLLKRGANFRIPTSTDSMNQVVQTSTLATVLPCANPP